MSENVNMELVLSAEGHVYLYHSDQAQGTISDPIEQNQITDLIRHNEGQFVIGSSCFFSV